jgi:hypothetical protein
MQELDLYNFKLNIYENTSMPDDFIKKIIVEYKPEDALIAIFTKYGITMERNFSYGEKYNYFYNLANQIKRVSGYGYSDDDIAIYALYITPIYPILNSSDINDIIKSLENIFNLKASGENEVFAQETVKYKLLSLYSNQIDDRYEDMKSLLASLNASQATYEIVKAKVLSKIQ